MKKQLLPFLIFAAGTAMAQTTGSVSVNLTNKLLTNPDFELLDIAAEGESPHVVEATGESTLYDQAYNKIPFGWKTNVEEFSGKSRGISADAHNPHGKSNGIYQPINSKQPPTYSINGQKAPIDAKGLLFSKGKKGFK